MAAPISWMTLKLMRKANTLIIDGAGRVTLDQVTHAGVFNFGLHDGFRSRAAANVPHAHEQNSDLGLPHMFYLE